MTCSRSNGFTLLELSIVLVIIGLIAGGTLLGRDLIELARLRKTISQKEQIETAVNAFLGKYNGLPGDLVWTKAQPMGLATFDAAQSDSKGLGDGNGVIESTGNDYYTMGERALFFVHLQQAGLVAHGLKTDYIALDDTGHPGWLGAILETPETIGTLFPPSPLGSASFFQPNSRNGENYLQISVVTRIVPTGYNELEPAVTPLQGLYLDQKLDDGAPLTGRVMAAEKTGFIEIHGVGTSDVDCITSDQPDAVYNTLAAGNNKVCNVAFKTPF